MSQHIFHHFFLSSPILRLTLLNILWAIALTLNILAYLSGKVPAAYLVLTMLLTGFLFMLHGFLILTDTHDAGRNEQL